MKKNKVKGGFRWRIGTAVKDYAERIGNKPLKGVAIRFRG